MPGSSQESSSEDQNIDTKVERQLDQNIPLLFEPDRCWTDKVGIEVNDMILTINPDG